MKKILALTLGLMLIAGSAYAAGDLDITGNITVNGKAGIGLTAPAAKLDVLSSEISGLNVVTTKTGSGWLTGAKFTFTDTSSAQNLSGLSVSYTHDGSVTTNHGASTVSMNLNGSGTSGLDIGHVAQGSYMTFGGNGGTGYNYTQANAYAFALRGYVGTTGTKAHYIENIGGLQILHGYDNTYKTLSAKNLYGIIVGDISQYGSGGLNAVTNAGGIQINKQTDSAGGRIANIQGLWMNGDGAGADIVLGPNKETRIYSSSGELYVKDGAGNVTKISPHDQETGEWVYYSKNLKTGVVKQVNMEKLVNLVEKLTGEKLMIETME
jgi:hypothetical protein